MNINTADYVGYTKGLVGQLIKEWGGATDADMDDMQGEAMLALVKAVKRYDESRGSFKTFLHRVVRNRLIDWRDKEDRDLKFQQPTGLAFADDIPSL